MNNHRTPATALPEHQIKRRIAASHRSRAQLKYRKPAIDEGEILPVPTARRAVTRSWECTQTYSNPEFLPPPALHRYNSIGIQCALGRDLEAGPLHAARRQDETVEDLIA